MATLRGRAKQDIMRAKNNANRIQERLIWIIEEYSEYPDFIDMLQSAFVCADMLSDFLGKILENQP